MEVDVSHRVAHEDPTETMTFPKDLTEKESIHQYKLNTGNRQHSQNRE